MDELQFTEGQLVAYGASGVCVIDEIKKMRLLPDMPSEMYYILRTIRDGASKVFVPVNNTGLVSKMRSIMNEDQIKKMIEDTGFDEMQWNDNRRERSDEFHNIIGEGVSGKLLSMIYCIHKRKDSLTDMGKKLPVTDSNALKTAEKLLEDEIACVMHIEEDDVYDFIKETLGKR